MTRQVQLLLLVGPLVAATFCLKPNNHCILCRSVLGSYLLLSPATNVLWMGTMPSPGTWWPDRCSPMSKSAADRALGPPRAALDALPLGASGFVDLRCYFSDQAVRSSPCALCAARPGLLQYGLMQASAHLGWGVGVVWHCEWCPGLSCCWAKLGCAVLGKACVTHVILVISALVVHLIEGVSCTCADLAPRCKYCRCMCCACTQEAHMAPVQASTVGRLVHA